MIMPNGKDISWEEYIKYMSVKEGETVDQKTFLDDNHTGFEEPFFEEALRVSRMIKKCI